jgi:hypothetical protein
MKEPLFEIGDIAHYPNGEKAEIRAIGPVFVILRFAPNDYRKARVRAFEDAVALHLAGRPQPPLAIVRMSLAEGLAFARKDQPKVSADDAHAQAQQVMAEQSGSCEHGTPFRYPCARCIYSEPPYGSGPDKWQEVAA